MIQYEDIKECEYVRINHLNAKRLFPHIADKVKRKATLYFVREDGTIWTYRENANQHVGEWHKRATSKTTETYGHQVIRLPVDLDSDGKLVYKTMYVHKLVCEAFHGPCPYKNESYAVGFKDGNANNVASWNLYWRTQDERDETEQKAREFRRLFEMVSRECIEVSE